MFPQELGTIATSLYKESGITFSTERLAATVLNMLEPLVDTVENAAFLEETRRRSVVIGKEITVLRGNETFTARAVGIDDTGGLIIEKDGNTAALTSGEVSVRL